MIIKIKQFWRIITTALSFIIFGVGGIFFAFIYLPIMRILIKDPIERRNNTQKAIKKTFKAYLLMMRFLGVFDYKINNAERLDDDYGCLIVANHPSLLDYVFLASILPRCDCIVKAALFDNFFMRAVLKSAQYIPNCEPNLLLPLCKSCLDDNGMMLIFPEGTRTKQGLDIVLQRGAAHLALHCLADIRVIHIQCEPLILSKEAKWYYTPQTKPIFTITVGDKIKIEHFIDDSLPPSIMARRITKRFDEELRWIKQDRI